MNNLTRNWPFLFIITSIIFIIWPLVLPGYFSHHDDLQVMRIFQMRKCLQDFQIPCRWVPDMGYGNGYPLFNYYAVFPYYIGALLSFVFGYIVSAKILFAIPIITGAISMFLLSRKLFGLYGGVAASVLFTYIPYHALDLYVRGDITESFAIATIPLCLYFSLKLIKEGKIKYFAGLAVSLDIFLTSHNIMTMLFIPVFFLLSLYWLIFENLKNWPKLLTAVVVGFGLASFFIIPAYFEKDLVQIDNLIRLDLNFRAHFTTINQLFFSRQWGYGASVLGSNDTISFQVGWPYWWVVIFVFLLLIFNLKSFKRQLFPLMLISIFVFSVFMTHTRSAFIWEKIDVLKFTQFPWRFLAVSTFIASLLGGFLIKSFKPSWQKYLMLIIVITTFLLNWSYFRPKEFYLNLTDQQKLSGKLLNEQKKAVILDYLPKNAVEPKEPASKKPILLKGDATFKDFINKSNTWQFSTKVFKDALIEVPIFDFPIWNVTINDKNTTYQRSDTGRIVINLKKDKEYIVKGKFINTKLRYYSNLISVIAFIGLVIYSTYGKSKKLF